MKRIVQIICLLLCSTLQTMAQCSLCTKTAQQLGEGPAKGLNMGILYLAVTPLLIISILAIRYYRNNRHSHS